MTISDPQRLTEIVARWWNFTEPQCQDWWYSAIRHVQRNVEDVCVHERNEKTTEPDVHPSRYDGEIFGHATEDIWWLLQELGVGMP